MMRFAICADHPAVADYLPRNYQVILRVAGVTVIGGCDGDHGWTMDGYVLPRLQSGLHAAREITLHREPHDAVVGLLSLIDGADWRSDEQAAVLLPALRVIFAEAIRNDAAGCCDQGGQ